VVVVAGVLADELLELELEEPVSLFVVPHAARNSTEAIRPAAVESLLVFIADPKSCRASATSVAENMGTRRMRRNG
jgi:hypothetical protein